jgi:small subunit ribosomal protein S20
MATTNSDKNKSEKKRVKQSSARKRMHQANQRREVNRSVRGALASIRRNFFEAVANGDKEKIRELRVAYTSALDKAMKQGAIKRNTADRRKSRAALKAQAS